MSRADALRLGYSRRSIDHLVRVGRWRRLLPRVYLTVDTLLWLDRQVAALKFAGPAALLTGAAALTDRRLRCVREPPARLLVLVPPDVSARSTGFARIRRTHRMPSPAHLPGPRCAPMARAIADLALETQHLDDVRTLVVQAVRADLCSLDELAVELETGPRNGSGHLRTAIDDIRGGAWSAPEAAAARLLRSARIPAFEQNGEVRLPGGGRYFADFLWAELRAVLEIDSAEHHLDPRDWRATMSRHFALETLGYSVVHRTPRDITSDPGAFVEGIRQWLTARAAEFS